MNPFTESTVARPLSDGPFGQKPVDPAHARWPADSAAVDGGSEGTTATHASELPIVSKASLPDRPARDSTPLPVIVRRKRRRISLPAVWLLAGSLAATALMLPPKAHATDVNQANLEQLKVVRGIGPKTASLIIEERARGGPYESLSDLSDRVKGIGPKKASALQQAGLTVGASSSKIAGASAATPAHSKPGR